MEIKYQIKLTDIVEVFVQDLHKEVDHFQHQQFIVFFVHDCDEVKTCISLVYDLVIVPFKEITRLCISGQDDIVDLFDVLLSLAC